MKIRTIKALAVVLLVSVFSQAEEKNTATKFTAEQLGARFPYDLGPSTVDVSDYPEIQQANYRVFQNNCSQCHTLARPLNSPLVERKDWQRYVRRMHMKAETRDKAQISKADAQKIVDFLTYDSRRRKIEAKKDFDAKSQELKTLFEEVEKERSRLKIEQDKKKARESAPYTGN